MNDNERGEERYERNDVEVSRPFNTMGQLLGKQMLNYFLSLIISLFSELQVHYISAWDFGSRLWNITLPESESIENIAIGKTFLILATSQRYFRTFSYAGTQKIIFCYSGNALGC